MTVLLIKCIRCNIPSSFISNFFTYVLSEHPQKTFIMLCRFWPLGGDAVSLGTFLAGVWQIMVSLLCFYMMGLGANLLRGKLHTVPIAVLIVTMISIKAYQYLR